MEEFEWNVVHEGQLLDAMVGHKPVGMFIYKYNVKHNLKIIYRYQQILPNGIHLGQVQRKVDRNSAI